MNEAQFHGCPDRAERLFMWTFRNDPSPRRIQEGIGERLQRELSPSPATTNISLVFFHGPSWVAEDAEAWRAEGSFDRTCDPPVQLLGYV